MIWAKEETLPREEIERIQLTKLKDTVRYIYDRVKPYREKWIWQVYVRKIYRRWKIKKTAVYI